MRAAVRADFPDFTNTVHHGVCCRGTRPQRAAPSVLLAVVCGVDGVHERLLALPRGLCRSRRLRARAPALRHTVLEPRIDDAPRALREAGARPAGARPACAVRGDPPIPHCSRRRRRRATVRRTLGNATEARGAGRAGRGARGGARPGSSSRLRSVRVRSPARRSRRASGSAASRAAASLARRTLACSSRILSALAPCPPPSPRRSVRGRARLRGERCRAARVATAPSTRARTTWREMSRWIFVRSHLDSAYPCGTPREKKKRISTGPAQRATRVPNSALRGRDTPGGAGRWRRLPCRPGGARAAPRRTAALGTASPCSWSGPFFGFCPAAVRPSSRARACVRACCARAACVLRGRAWSSRSKGRMRCPISTG